MKANPTKFQAICIGKNAHENIASFKVDSVEIKCEENVTLLGVNIDFMLSFDDHVTDICKKNFKTTGSFKTSWMNDHYLGKSCSFGLPRVPFVNCRRFMYLVISLLLYRAGCGI